MDQETQTTKAFRGWLQQNGAYIHPSAFFAQGPYGFSLFTSTTLDKDSTIVSCPFDLILTPLVAKNALQSLVGSQCTLNDREAVCAYLVLHSAACRMKIEAVKQPDEINKILRHQEYIDTLPTSLTTPLFFSEQELELLRGTNLYAATVERKQQWQEGWRVALTYLQTLHLTEEDFTWENFIRAQTWLSSRAFPSSLMEDPPSLFNPTAAPVLVPLVDALNHARGTPISWSIDQRDRSSDNPSPKSLSLVSHNAIQSGDELFNNYGPKGNWELLLGYGFTLPANPDDTLLLKLPGSEHRFTIARGAQGDAQAVWDEVGRRLEEGFPREDEMDDDDEDNEDVKNAELQLEIGQVLPEMLRDLQAKLPRPPERNAPPLVGVRSDIRQMINEYAKGQREILDDLLAFADTRLKAAIDRAQELGIDITLGSEDED